MRQAVVPGRWFSVATHPGSSVGSDEAEADEDDPAAWELVAPDPLPVFEFWAVEFWAVGFWVSALWVHPVTIRHTSSDTTSARR